MKRILLPLVVGACLLLPAAEVAAQRAEGEPAFAKPAPRVTKRDAARASAPWARPVGTARTLDDIRIQGELPVPQVLFITARDPWRMLEFQHHRYLRAGAQLGQATVLPGWIVVSQDPITAGKETAR